VNAAELLPRLEAVERIGPGRWMARCPAHEDRTPSLAVSDGDRGAVLHCHAGCSQESVVNALGMRFSDLFHDPPSPNGSGSDIVATYDYRDEDGEMLFQVVRRLPKDFRQRRPDGEGGWVWSTRGVRRVLYRLPEVMEAVALGKPIYVCEGEKDVEAVERAGGVATTVPGGAGRWRPEYSETLRGARVRIVADRDEAGAAHAQEVADALHGIAEEVEIVLPATGKDASDHLDAGHDLEQFVPHGDGAESLEEDVGAENAFPLLRDLLARPELLEPPEEILPKFAWKGRATGLIGPDKSGKSTLASHGVAAVSSGGAWLGERLVPGPTVVVAPDEAVGDTVRRLGEVDADPDRVRVLALRPPDLLGKLHDLLSAHPADLVVVDSLAEWARITAGRAPDDGDSAGWGAVIRPLVQVSRDHDCAVLLLHHPRRSDGQYRGSGEIAAALDCLLEMGMPQNGEDPTLRRFRGRARWPVEDFTLRMEEHGYVLGSGGPVPVEARVLSGVSMNPGTTRSESYRRLGGRKATHTAAVNALVEADALRDRAGKLYLPNQVEEDLL